MTPVPFTQVPEPEAFGGVPKILHTFYDADQNGRAQPGEYRGNVLFFDAPAPVDPNADWFVEGATFIIGSPREVGLFASGWTIDFELEIFGGWIEVGNPTTIVGGVPGDDDDEEEGTPSLYGSALPELLVERTHEDRDIFPGGGDDIVVGGAGWNTVHLYGASGFAIDFALGMAEALDGSATIDFEAVEGFSGTNLSDRMISDAGSHLLAGNGGGDRLFGEEGSDTLHGGTGRDRLDGGTGRDLLLGGGGDDTLMGKQGHDLVLGGGGDDSATGGGGNDTLRGNSGDDSLFGNAGDDLLLGHAGADDLRGGDGKDRLKGGAGNDTLMGGVGRDKLVGGDGDDLLIGQSGGDVIHGGAGQNHMVGGNGDDFIYTETGGFTVKAGADDDLIWVGTGSGTIDGGAGADIVYLPYLEAEAQVEIRASGAILVTHGDAEILIKDADLQWVDSV